MSGATWGRALSGEYHRLRSYEFRWQTVACGDRVDVVDVYHCAEEAGPHALPAIGTVCARCIHADRGGEPS